MKKKYAPPVAPVRTPAAPPILVYGDPTAESARRRLHDNLLTGLLILSALLHFVGLHYPSQVVFDEFHYGKSLEHYLVNHQRFFDQHPPHGKLLVLGGAYLFGYRGGGNFERIGNPNPPKACFALRVVPALIGTFLPLVFFALLRLLGASFAAAFLGAFAILFDNGLLVQARTLAFEPLLVLGIWGSLAATLRALRETNKKKRRAFLLLAGAAGAMAFGTKLTGLLGIGLSLSLLAYTALRRFEIGTFFQTTKDTAWCLLGFLVIYFAGFYAHHALVPLPGPADAFYTSTGNKFIDTLTLQKTIYVSHATTTSDHQDASRWWSWPYMKTPVYMWTAPQANMYFIGNPVLWWGSSILLGIMCLAFFFSRFGRNPLWRSPSKKTIRLGIGLSMFGFACGYFPYAGITRVMFLYHYLPPLSFGLGALLLWWESLGLFGDGSWKAQRKGYYTTLALLFLGFVAFAPMTFGNPMPEMYYKTLFAWFPSWR